jgi:hypothetical protein
MSYSRWHWRIFNVVARLWGIGFLLAGLLGLPQVLFFKSPPPSDDGLVLAVSLFAVVVGVLVIRVRPYRPDLDGYASAFKSTYERQRTWWTGEPK